MEKENRLNKTACSHIKEPMSKIRKQYMARLVGRIVVLVFCTLLFLFKPERFDILQGMNFFKEFSLFHILWGIWMFDMICQMIPIHKELPLGSQKLFKKRFKPISEKINYQALRNYVINTTKAAYKVFYDYLYRKNMPWKYEPLAEEMMKIHNEDKCNDTYGRERMYLALLLKKEAREIAVYIPSEGTARKVMD